MWANLKHLVKVNMNSPLYLLPQWETQLSFYTYELTHVTRHDQLYVCLKLNRNCTICLLFRTDSRADHSLVSIRAQRKPIKKSRLRFCWLISNWKTSSYYTFLYLSMVMQYEVMSNGLLCVMFTSETWKWWTW